MLGLLYRNCLTAKLLKSFRILTAGATLSVSRPIANELSFPQQTEKSLFGKLKQKNYYKPSILNPVKCRLPGRRMRNIWRARFLTFPFGMLKKVRV